MHWGNSCCLLSFHVTDISKCLRWGDKFTAMIRKVKVCCLCEKWESGGIESFLANTFSCFDFDRFEIDIIAVTLNSSIFTAKLDECGIRFFELSGSRNDFVKNRKLLLDLLEREKYDVFHVNAFHGAQFYYLGLAKKAGIPVRIAHSHNTKLKKGALHCLKTVLHKSSKFFWASDATDFWACSYEAARFMFPQKIFDRNSICIIPNGIETTRFKFCETGRTSVRERMGLNDHFLIGHVGRFSEQKNQKFLLHIFAELLKFNPNSRLVLVGDGEMRAELEIEADLLGIANEVHFNGVSDCVEQWLWAMDAFVFPSLFEGLGMAVVEAQAAGLPVICSECVPVEARILPSMQCLPLNLGASKWAEAILNCPKNIAHREDCAMLVRAKGFDQSDVAHKVESAYLHSATD